MTQALEAGIRFAAENETRYIDELCEILRIPSISTREEHAPDVARAAAWIGEAMRAAGLDGVEVIRREGRCPLVYGEWLGAGPKAPTVLFYCHYDVQPAAMEDGWVSEPFVPEIREGRLYARGAVDSKSHVMIQLKAAEAALANGKPPINFKYSLRRRGREQWRPHHRFRARKSGANSCRLRGRQRWQHAGYRATSARVCLARHREL